MPYAGMLAIKRQIRYILPYISYITNRLILFNYQHISLRRVGIAEMALLRLQSKRNNAISVSAILLNLAEIDLSLPGPAFLPLGFGLGRDEDVFCWPQL